MKKVISLVLAIVIIFSLSIPVQAISAPSFDITSTNSYSEWPVQALVVRQIQDCKMDSPSGWTSIN